MIRDSLIQLFLRNMLLDGLSENEIDIPVTFENISAKNYTGTYINEMLIPITETAYNDFVEEGHGIYKITVFSDSGTGLSFVDTVDTIKSIFNRGDYIISTDDNISICIDNVTTGQTFTSRDSDKIQRSVAVEYRKFKN